MKGVSAVIATILMLAITIALAGTAAYYFTTISTSREKVLTLVDFFCVSGSATWNVRNEGGTPIAASEMSLISVSEACTTDPTVPSGGIGARNSTDLTASGCTAGRFHTYRFRGPANSVELTVSC